MAYPSFRQTVVPLSDSERATLSAIYKEAGLRKVTPSIQAFKRARKVHYV